MKYHLDTTFLVDWRRSDPRILDLRTEILAGVHTVSIDPIVQTEFFAAPRVNRSYELVFDAIAEVATCVDLSYRVSRLAASWLGPMDQAQRRARFADALIAAAASSQDATVVTSDTGMSLFPIPVLLY